MSYAIVHDNARLWVTHDGRLLGGYTAGQLRTYVFPFYSPAGALLLQEAPPDHPHHQGIWTGLEVDGHDLWNAGSFSVPRNRQELAVPLGEIERSCTDRGARLAHEVRWTSVDGADLLRERREVVFRVAPHCTVLEWRSVFHHPDKATRLGQTKESGLAIRVPPHWETPRGGLIRNAEGGEGEPGCFDRISAWLGVEGGVVADRRAGIVMQPTSAPCPWFTRDYGVHVYNPARHEAVHLAPGQTLAWSMRVLGYDGARSVAEIGRLVAAAGRTPEHGR